MSGMRSIDSITKQKGRGVLFAYNCDPALYNSDLTQDNCDPISHNRNRR